MNLDEQARYIMHLPDNWDDEGAIKYDPVDINQAKKFILGTIEKYHAQSHQSMDAHFIMPDMTPGPNGSIDILWQFEPRGILMNLPQYHKLATYYGDNKSDINIKGTWDITKPASWLIFWLIS